MEQLKRSIQSADEIRTLDFFGQEYRGGKRSVCDFSMTTCAKHKGKMNESLRLSMVFRNDTIKHISKSGYMEFAISGNRLYFREADSRGYKITIKGKNNNGYLQPTSDSLIEFYNEHKNKNGYIDTDIKADNDLGYYYIEAGLDWKGANK